MAKHLARHRVLCQHAKKYHITTMMRASYFGMESGWYDRFIDAVKADERDPKAISLEAGCGQNYLQQIMKYRKRPGVDRFVRILNVLGSASALYIILGIDATQRDEEFFRVAVGLDGDLKEDAYRLLEKIKGREDKPAPRPSPDP